MFLKGEKKEKKVLNYIAVRTSTQAFWEICRMVAKCRLISLYVQTALLIRWISDFTGINVAGRWWEREGPCVFDCLRLSKAVRASGLELMLSVFSGGSVEVYNCATGSADCSQCLGREDLGHRCLWSESSSSCRLHTESPQVSEACPPPEIRKVRPKGNVEGVLGVV